MNPEKENREISLEQVFILLNSIQYLKRHLSNEKTGLNSKEVGELQEQDGRLQDVLNEMLEEDRNKVYEKMSEEEKQYYKSRIN